MVFQRCLVGIAALLALSPATFAQVTATCQYQEYACGYELVDQGIYTLAFSLTTLLYLRRLLMTFEGYQDGDLFTASQTTPPQALPSALDNVQLLQVLYHCKDINNGIIGNSYCISGCIAMGDETHNAQCAM